MKGGRSRQWRNGIRQILFSSGVILWLSMTSWWLCSGYVQTNLSAERNARLTENRKSVQSMELWAANGTVTILLKHEIYRYFSRFDSPFSMRGEWRRAEKRSSLSRRLAHHYLGFGWESRVEIKEPFRGMYVGPPIPDYSESLDLNAPMWALPAVTSLPIIVILQLVAGSGRRRCNMCGGTIPTSVSAACNQCGVTRPRAFLWRVAVVALAACWVFTTCAWATSYFAPNYASLGTGELFVLPEFDHGLIRLDLEREVYRQNESHRIVLLAGWGISVDSPLNPMWPTTHWGFGGDYHSTRIQNPHPLQYESTTSTKLVAPILVPWIINLISLIMLFLWRRRIISRAALNCCSTCGYDLTANVSGVCPECGTPALKFARCDTAVSAVQDARSRGKIE